MNLRMKKSLIADFGLYYSNQLINGTEKVVTITVWEMFDRNKEYIGIEKGKFVGERK